MACSISCNGVILSDKKPVPGIIIIMGVSGSGKSLIGRRLASALQWKFLEGDACHPPENIDKMSRGIPLSDHDRRPWLERLRTEITQHLSRNEPAVLSCSALKTSYRKLLRGEDRRRVRFVYLRGDAETLRARLLARPEHFFRADMLKSQLQALEEPEEALTVDISLPPSVIVETVIDAFGMIRHSEVLLDGLMFPESPRWRAGRLWFTDQHARQIRVVDMSGRSEAIMTMDDLPGGLGWLPDGRLIVVSMTRRRLLQCTDCKLSEYADLSHLASFHCNDMIIDRQGRAYVGNFGYDINAGAAPTAAELVLVEPGGSVRIVARDMIFPNGMALTPDGGTLIVAETFASRISAFDIKASGALANRRLWADIKPGNPDGLCLDTEGGLWVAAPNSGEVLRVCEGGAVTARIQTTAAPYACMLGGPERKTLFIASSKTSDPDEAVHRRSGRIEVAVVDISG